MKSIVLRYGVKSEWKNYPIMERFHIINKSNFSIDPNNKYLFYPLSPLYDSYAFSNNRSRTNSTEFVSKFHTDAKPWNFVGSLP
jgi:hypothetical protein